MTVKNKKRTRKFFQRMSNLLIFAAGVVCAVWIFAFGMRTDHNTTIFVAALITAVMATFLSVVSSCIAESIDDNIRRERKSKLAKEWWNRV